MLQYVLVIFLSLLSAYLVRRVAVKYNFFSQSDFRRRQVSSVPLLGGLAVWLSWSIVSLFFNAKDSYPLIISSFPLVLLGCYEDKLRVNKIHKLAVQTFSIGVFFYLHKDSATWFQQWGGSEWSGWLVHGLWILFLMSAVEMMDVMDGLAASFAVTALVSFYFLTSDLSLLLLSGSFVGFLFWNWPRAKMYLGKSGGMLVGFLLASQISYSDSKNNIWIIPLVFLVLLYPHINFFISLSRKKTIFMQELIKDREQIHLKLKRIGLGATKSLLLLIYFNAVMATLSVVAYYQSNYIFSLALFSVGLLSGIAHVLVLDYLEKRITTQSAKIGSDILHELFKSSKNILMPRFPRGVLINFEVYYPLLVDGSVTDMKKFFQDVNIFLSEKIKVESCMVSGNVLFVYNLTGPDQDMLSQQFKELTVNHELLKNSISLPWGLTHVREPQESRLFIKKYGSNFLYQTMSDTTKKAA